MRKSFLGRVIATFLIVVVAFSSVRPVTAATNEYGFTELDPASDEAQALLYGSDTNDYALGLASHFVIFTKEVTIEGGADCEGRIASDEFNLPTGFQDGYPIKGALTSATNANSGSQNGSADVICNNSISGEFGYVQHNHNGQTHRFVVSTDVQRVVGPVANSVKANTYAVEPNSLIDFEKEFQRLNDLSHKFSTKDNGTVSMAANKTLTLNGTDSKVNFFNVSKEDFESAGRLNLNIPEGSFAIINIPGKEVNYTAAMSDALYYNGSQQGQSSVANTRILFNFYEATKVNLLKATRASILAPRAYVEDKSGEHWGHHSAQIVARKLYLDNQIDFRAFVMPSSFLGELFETPVDGEDYTVRYLYYDAEGNLKELPGGPDGFYKIFIDAERAPEYKEHYNDNDPRPYQAGTVIQAIDSDADETAALSLMNNGHGPEAEALKLYADLAASNCEIRFQVYEDGKTSKDALKGGPAGGLLNPDTYAALDRKADIGWDDTYTISTSNVYFIMYPAAKVTVDVSWDDKQNKSGKRPETFNVKLSENLYNPSSDSVQAKARENTELLSANETVAVKYDDSLGRDITFDVYNDSYSYYVPLFGMQPDINGDAGTGRTFGTTVDKFDGADSVFGITYTVPDGYIDVTGTKADKPESGVTDKNGNVLVDENGVVAQYHIVLRGEYTATFYVVDRNGNRTKVTKEDFTDPYRGFDTTETLPSITTTEINQILGNNNVPDGYTITWKDISKNGRTYEAGSDNYSFDYEDVIFETSLRRSEIIGENNVPWLYAHIILYNNSHYIPAPMVYDRLQADNVSGEYTFIQKRISQYEMTHYGFDPNLKNEYKNDRFFLFAFAYGVDKERAAQSRVTVSTKGFGKGVTDFVYSTQNTPNTKSTFCAMPGIETSPNRTIQELVPSDPYVDDYDGMNYFRLVLPADVFENETLYITVYYTDANGQESVWFYYTLNMKENKHWTLQGK